MHFRFVFNINEVLPQVLFSLPCFFCSVFSFLTSTQIHLILSQPPFTSHLEEALTNLSRLEFLFVFLSLPLL